FLQPLARVLHAIAVVMIVGPGTKLHFLDRDDDLFLFRLVRFLFGFVLKLAKVDDLANGRLGVRRDFDQVHAPVARLANSIACVHHTELFAVVANHTHLGNAYALVNSSNRSTPKIRTAAATKTCSYWCTS